MADWLIGQRWASHLQSMEQMEQTQIIINLNAMASNDFIIFVCFFTHDGISHVRLALTNSIKCMYISYQSRSRLPNQQ